MNIVNRVIYHIKDLKPGTKLKVKDINCCAISSLSSNMRFDIDEIVIISNEFTCIYYTCENTRLCNFCWTNGSEIKFKSIDKKKHASSCYYKLENIDGSELK